VLYNKVDAKVHQIFYLAILFIENFIVNDHQ